MTSAAAAPSLIERARLLLRERFGHADFRPGQEEAIRRILEGEDLTVVMPTGSGKSACYQLPALLRDGLTLVVSPLIALMKDQVEALLARGIPAAYVNSTLRADEQADRLARAASGDLQLLYVAPERLAAPSFLRTMRARPPRLVAVDEAHCISQWGHDFRPAYLGIKTFLDAMADLPGGRPQVLGLTGTATARVREDVSVQLGIPRERTWITGFHRPNLRLVARPCESRGARRDQIAQVVQGVAGSGIVYAGTRKDVEEVTETLRADGVSAACYHAGLPDEVRAEVQESFLADRVRVMVATNAFGMGIDKPDVRFVIHHSLPGSVEAYWQEAGRAGRDGKPSWCVLLHGRADRHLHEFFLDGTCPPEGVLEEAWASLARLREDPVRIPVAQLAERAGVPEMSFGGALRILEEAGLVARSDERDPAVEGRASRTRALRVVGRDLPRSEVTRRLEPHVKSARERRRRGTERIDAMESWARTRSCRHRALVRHFGDDLEPTCSACDNCKDWKPKADVAAPLAAGRERQRVRRLPAEGLAEVEPIALAAVGAVHERFGVSVAALLLRGSRSGKVLKAGLDRNGFYGALARLSKAQVDAVLAGLMDQGLIESGGGIRPVVRLTEEGRLRLGG